MENQKQFNSDKEAFLLSDSDSENGEIRLPLEEPRREHPYLGALSAFAGTSAVLLNAYLMQVLHRNFIY